MSDAAEKVEAPAEQVVEQIQPKAAEVVKNLKAELDMLRAARVGRERALKAWEQKAKAELRAEEAQATGFLKAKWRAIVRWWLNFTTIRFWLCGLARTGADWEVIGVFNTHGKAARICRDKRYFIAPIGLNRPFGEDTVNWPGLEVPNTTEAPEQK